MAAHQLTSIVKRSVPVVKACSEWGACSKDFHYMFTTGSVFTKILVTTEVYYSLQILLQASVYYIFTTGKYVVNREPAVNTLGH